MDKIPDIVASEHFNELLWQFQCFDECKRNCVFGRSEKIHLLHRQLYVKQLELAQLERKLREAENKAL